MPKYGNVRAYKPRNTRDSYNPGPAPLQPQPLPLDPAYDLGVAGANRDYDIASGDIAYGQGRARQDYGFDDTSNPFNKKALLERMYQQNQRGNLNSMAAGGQLYSGALQRQQDAGTFQFQQSSDVLRREYDDLMHGYASAQAQAGSDRDNALAGLFGERLDRAPRASDPPRAKGTPKKKGRRKSTYDRYRP